MSSAAKPLSAAEPSSTQEVAIPWTPLLWFGLLLVLCYAPVISRLVVQWMNDDDVGHGFFVPIVAGWIAWQKRFELLNGPHRSNPLGLVIVGFAAVQLYIGTLGAELFLSRTALVESIVGIVLFLGGMHALRVLAFPLFMLLFMIPIPTLIYNQITFPLQLFASRVAAFVLEQVGVPVLRDGNVLELASQKLSVVEACSGIRSLLSLSFLSLVYAWFFDSKAWMRAALLVATVPIAILANAGRVTMTGLMSEINPELAQGTAHTASGWAVFAIALVMLVFTHQLLDRTYRILNGPAKA